jgi:hypothetical protein
MGFYSGDIAGFATRGCPALAKFEQEDYGCCIMNRQKAHKGGKKRPVRRLMQKSRQKMIGFCDYGGDGSP